MIKDNEKRTHTAYGYRRIGRKSVRAIIIGEGYIDEHNVAHGFVDSLPLGFNGYWTLHPKGGAPPAPEPQPMRPGEDETDNE